MPVRCFSSAAVSRPWNPQVKHSKLVDHPRADPGGPSMMSSARQVLRGQSTGVSGGTGRYLVIRGLRWDAPQCQGG